MAELDYSDLDDFDEEDEESIDYDAITHYAKEGLKNPTMIAHVMGLPVKWFLDTHKEKVNLAIERGIALLAMEVTGQIKRSAAAGDFQAQKYILQNIDTEWSDRKEVVQKGLINIEDLPTLRELFNKGIRHEKEKQVNTIEGEFSEE